MFYNTNKQKRFLSFVFDSVLGPLRLAVIEARFKAPFQPKQPFKGAQLRQIKLLEGLKVSIFFLNDRVTNLPPRQSNVFNVKDLLPILIQKGFY